MELASRTPSLLSKPFRWALFYPVKFHFLVILSCALFCLAECGPCINNGMQKSAGRDACSTYSENYGVRFQDFVTGDVSSDNGNPSMQMNFESVCTDAHSFCFPSTLPGFSSLEHELQYTAFGISGSKPDATQSVGPAQATESMSNSSWLTDHGIFRLFNERMVSCSIKSSDGNNEFESTHVDSSTQKYLPSCIVPLQDDTKTEHQKYRNSEMTKIVSFDGSSSPPVKIKPHVLDWGRKYVYFPSSAFITLENACTDCVLHVYQLYSTSAQFYPCNFTEILLGPGEVASICFVFLPRWVGSSSAHLILQTSSGGFLVQAKGFAIESPYGIQPLQGLEGSSSGRWRKNLTLFNPFDESLLVEEVALWFSISHENNSYSAEAVCNVKDFERSVLGLLSSKDWLVVGSDGVGLPLMAVRPHKNWVIEPTNNETIIEMDFSVASQGKLFGGFCMQLQRSSQDGYDAVVVPLEIQLDGKPSDTDASGYVSGLLEVLVSHGTSNTVVLAVSLRNEAPYPLAIVNISESTGTDYFQIKYKEGLLLFPGTLTQVAVVTCSKFFSEVHGSPPEVSSINSNCKLLVLTNDSRSSQIEFSCQEILDVCLRNMMDSSIENPPLTENAQPANSKRGSLGGGSYLQFQMVKESEIVEIDEMVLKNWKSQGTRVDMSVLDDHEVVFPTVQVGTYESKWITVKNPSQEPVLMQLILNSGVIIDECKDLYGSIQFPLISRNFSESMGPWYGFSVPESAVTEAYVHPYGTVSFGPIFFQPSNRCAWRSSALIRNNLSGVEWLSLRGFGGLLSLVLFQESEPVRSIEFDLNMTNPLKISVPIDVQEPTYACSQPLMKEIYAKNTGDLPVEVTKIGISGRACALDGFVLHTCKGFTLEPGQSTKFLMSYQADFSATSLHRDLELALSSGILVIPMKASIPMCMISLCKKSLFWVRVKKCCGAALFAALLIFLIFCCIFPSAVACGSDEYLCKRANEPIPIERSRGKPSRVHRNSKNNKSSLSSGLDELLMPVGQGRSLKYEFFGQDPAKDGALQRGLISQNAKSSPDHCVRRNNSEDNSVEKAAVSSPQSVLNSDMHGVTQTSNLTVRTAKEKGRRRRKKKASGTGLLEVSSSQSGNSTPSSPLSPVTSMTSIPMRSLSPHAIQSNKNKNPYSQVADSCFEKVHNSNSLCKAKALESNASVKFQSSCFPPAQVQVEHRKSYSKALTLPSPNLPYAAGPARRVVYPSPVPASGCTVAPHARAPGSEVHKQTTARAEGKARLGDDFTYDIWGDHWSGLPLMGRPKYASSNISDASGSDSNSFFASDPQDLMTQFHRRSHATT